MIETVNQTRFSQKLKADFEAAFTLVFSGYATPADRFKNDTDWAQSLHQTLGEVCRQMPMVIIGLRTATPVDATLVKAIEDAREHLEIKFGTRSRFRNDFEWAVSMKSGFTAALTPMQKIRDAIQVDAQQTVARQIHEHEHKIIDAMDAIQILTCLVDNTALADGYNDEITIGKMRADLHRALTEGLIGANAIPDLSLGIEQSRPTGG